MSWLFKRNPWSTIESYSVKQDSLSSIEHAHCAKSLAWLGLPGWVCLVDGEEEPWTRHGTYLDTAREHGQIQAK